MESQDNSAKADDRKQDIFNPPQWITKPHNIPRRPRLRLRAVGGRDGWYCVFEDLNRVLVGSDFGEYPADYSYWTDEARSLYALMQAWRWLVRAYPNNDPESIVSMTCTQPRREARREGRRAA